MAGKTTILQEALMWERNERLKELKISPDTPGSEIVQLLLPNHRIFEKSVPYHNSRARNKYVHGSIRSGKTVSVCADDIKLIYINKPYPHFSFSPTQDNAEATVCIELEKLLRQNFLKFKRFKSDGLYEVYFGKGTSEAGLLYVWGAGNMIKGVTGASADFNEAYMIDRSQVLICEERISYEAPGLWYSKTFSGTYEPNNMNWGRDMYEMEDTDTDQVFKTSMSIYENPFISPEYIRDLEKKYSPAERKVYLEGKPVPIVTGTSVYTEFSREKNVKPYSEYLSEKRGDEVYKMILGFDFNVNPITASLWDIKGSVRRQINEFKISRSNTAELCEVAIAKIKNTYPGIESNKRSKFILYLTGDASGKREQTASFGWSDHDIIKKYFFASGIQCHAAFDKSNPPVNVRVNYVNNLFEKEQAIIFDNCKHSIEDRELSRYKQGAEGFVVDKSDKTRTHLNDAGDYALRLTGKMGIDETQGSSYGDDVVFGEKRRNY